MKELPKLHPMSAGNNSIFFDRVKKATIEELYEALSLYQYSRNQRAIVESEVHRRTPRHSDGEDPNIDGSMDF